MLEEGSAPVTAYETCAETITLGRKVGRDDGKNVQWDAVYANERISPFADIRQHGQDFMVELGNVVGGGAVEGVNVSFLKTSRGCPRLSLATYNREWAARFSSSLRAKMSCESDRPFPG